MTSLIFLGTIATLFIFFIRLLLKLIKRKPVGATFRTMLVIMLTYSTFWCVFYFLSGERIIPLGTDICFDDWCATVTNIEKPMALGSPDQEINPKGQFIILTIKMSNKARGIAQKPSEPRVHLLDDKGNSYAPSIEGQAMLEKQIGKQPSIDERLELNQSTTTKLVFDVPFDAEKVKVLIEEGPFITKLLLNEDKEVFIVP